MADRVLGPGRAILVVGSALAGVGLLVALAVILRDGAGPGAGLATGSPTETSGPTGSPPETEVFVYGTLMPGHLRYPSIREYVVEASRDRVVGRLFDTGAGFPAAKFGHSETFIEGYVLRLRPARAAEARRVLDQIEGSLYRAVSVETESGVTALAYEWVGSTDGFEPIEGMWRGDEA